MTDYVSTTEAALRLALSPRHVRNLAAAGELRQVARGVLDARSVDRYAALHRSGTQAWAQPTAWAAIALLSGVDVDWLGATQTSRLRKRLRDLDPEHLAERARARATVTRYAGHPAGLARIAPHLVVTDRSGLGLADTTASRVDGYATADEVGVLVRTHGLRPDEDGSITLRAISTETDLVRSIAYRSPVLAALDLITSLDPRERRAATTVLGDALDTFRHA